MKKNEKILECWTNRRWKTLRYFEPFWHRSTE